MNIPEVIKDWLLMRLKLGNYYVKSSDVETALVSYGQEYWGVKHTPSTYSREWRKFRADRQYRDIDIHNIEPVKTNSRQTTWMITPDYSRTGT